jgi:hypothetical protein
MSKMDLPAAPLARATSRRRDLGEAMTDLERVVAGPASADGWLDRVGVSLAGLRDALDGHIVEVEGPGGLLAEIVDLAPRLAPNTDDLRQDHVALLGAWLRTEATVRSAAGNQPAAVAAVRRRVTTLLGRLTIHRQAGSDLVFEAYNVDIGAVD